MMYSNAKKIINGVLTFSNFHHYVPVRYRYYAEKIAKGPIVRRFGYEDRIAREGVLPRNKDDERLPMPVYVPTYAWTHEKATFGQNDYIDILGGGKLRPADISYDVPKWLRGRKGNELSLLILKQKVFKNTDYEYHYPKRWNEISKRVKYLYRYLNYKTKTNFMKN